MSGPWHQNEDDRAFNALVIWVGVLVGFVLYAIVLYEQGVDLVPTLYLSAVAAPATIGIMIGGFHVTGWLMYGLPASVRSLLGDS